MIERIEVYQQTLDKINELVKSLETSPLRDSFVVMKLKEILKTNDFRIGDLAQRNDLDQVKGESEID